jgi:hypothetical protein
MSAPVQPVVHTPHPWETPWEIVDVVYGQGPEGSRVESYFVIGTKAEPDGECEYVCQVRCPQTWGAGAYHYDVEKTRSIATLISSAPDLLKACKFTLDAIAAMRDGDGSCISPAVMYMRLAIEKATGEVV